MTLFFHDVSNWQGDYHPAGPTIAKATEGSTFTDVNFVNNRDRTLAGGWPFLAYHFLVTSAEASIAAQVKHCTDVVGQGVPVMLDVEREGASAPSWADTKAFIEAHGHVTLGYIPQWYWRDVWGSPDLTWLTRNGIGMVSSDYTTYSDTGPGWDPYGGVNPVIWQYTDAPLDSNAYKGTVEGLRTLFAKGIDMTQPAQSYTETHSLWQAMFWGGSSCGHKVPTDATDPNNQWGGNPSNALLAKLDYIIKLLESGAGAHVHVTGPPVSATAPAPAPAPTPAP